MKTSSNHLKRHLPLLPLASIQLLFLPKAEKPAKALDGGNERARDAVPFLSSASAALGVFVQRQQPAKGKLTPSSERSCLPLYSATDLLVACETEGTHWGFLRTNNRHILYAFKCQLGFKHFTEEGRERGGGRRRKEQQGRVLLDMTLKDNTKQSSIINLLHPAFRLLLHFLFKSRTAWDCMGEVIQIIFKE